MNKKWFIASNMPTLSRIQQFQCDKQHEHDQSRCESLKHAEGYTYVMTDTVHECFAEYAVAQPFASSANQLPSAAPDSE